MKVTIFAGSSQASLFARSLPLATKLRDYGVKCTVVTPIAWDLIAKGKLGRILSIVTTHNPRKYIQTVMDLPDATIIEKVSSLQIYMFERVLKKRGVKNIFDLNDAIFLPTSNLFGIKVRPSSFCLEDILIESDYVTTNGHYLLNYVRYFNKNSCIIHDPINIDLFHPRKKRKNSDKTTITWEGNARVHYENLILLIKPLMKIAKEYNKSVKFKIASYLGDWRIKSLFSPLEKYMEVDYGSKKWLSTEKFAKLIYDSDIMVAPLRRTLWYEGKSALRVGIGMAMGIPVVASPVGEQKYVIKHGVNGFLARNEQEWYNYLRMLIEDEKLRRKMGREGRKTAEKELSIEVNGRKLYDIISSLVEG